MGYDNDPPEATQTAARIRVCTFSAFFCVFSWGRRKFSIHMVLYLNPLIRRRRQFGEFKDKCCLFPSTDWDNYSFLFSVAFTSY